LEVKKVPGNSLKDIKKARQEEAYFELFPEKKVHCTGRIFTQQKEALRKCSDCSKDLCIGDGTSWMCFDCHHHDYNKGVKHVRKKEINENEKTSSNSHGYEKSWKETQKEKVVWI